MTNLMRGQRLAELPLASHLLNCSFSTSCSAVVGPYLYFVCLCTGIHAFAQSVKNLIEEGQALCTALVHTL